MAFPILTFSQIRNAIIQEYRNGTGITAPDDSDAAIRADGTSSVVEGLYHHQAYIQRQIFVSTADEAYLYIHANEINLPRNGGTKASGTVKAISNVDLTINAGSQLTDGSGYYWSVVSDTVLTANKETTIDVIANQAGASWNYSGATLLWISPAAGLNGTVTVISIAGGTDEEDLEDWRTRLLERKQLGEFKDRLSDIEFMLSSIEGVKDIYPYPKRRGLGSFDVAITAVGEPPTLPSQDLIDSAQTVLDDYLGILCDCRIFSPTQQLVDVTAIITGSADLSEVETTIRNYIAELAPADPFQPAILISRIIALNNVLDVTLTPSNNIEPTVDWMNVYWLRAGTITVSAAS